MTYSGELLKKPEWVKLKLPSGPSYTNVKKTLGSLELHTVCEEARCPNISECWGMGTATIMIMGSTCSRRCRFCSVNSGKPALLDSKEPENVAIAISKLGLRYVVITSVCRDDLEDGGADHFAETIRTIRVNCPNTVLEALIPDFRGYKDSLYQIVKARPRVISHNIETVARLSPRVRDFRASYKQSLMVLQSINEFDPEIYTKSSLMLGLGETEQEIIETMKDLRSRKVSILTIGQYLQPSSRHIPVTEYITPERFAWFAEEARQLGFSFVASGSMVRSSYKVGEFFLKQPSIVSERSTAFCNGDSCSLDGTG
jgi:lipoyl synthase